MNSGPNFRDTIFALASAPGMAGVAVIRLSGAKAVEAVGSLTRKPLPAPRTLALRTLFESTNSERIDHGLVCHFPGPNSFTGEDVVEIQCHGGRAVLSAITAELVRQRVRPAEPGEFSRRAVEHGKLDLTRAEAIADLVAADTQAQRHQALKQMDGALSNLYEDWRARLISSAAWIEVSIDFADEDIPPEALARSREGLKELKDEIEAHLDDKGRGEILRDGFHVAIIGPPNAGKSALLNALAKRDVAIVSDIAGTTRDIIEVKLDLNGYPVILADTAGMRETDDPIEAEGLRRAKDRAASAHFRLLVLDGSTKARPAIDADLTVFNKSDLAVPAGSGLCISAKTGAGLPALVEALTAAADEMMRGDAPVLTRERHRANLEDAACALGNGLNAQDPELVAEHVRQALHALGRITGRVDLDELLDVVFRDFCIGK